MKIDEENRLFEFLENRYLIGKSGINGHVCVPRMQDVFDIHRRPSLQELIVDWPILVARVKEKVRDKS